MSVEIKCLNANSEQVGPVVEMHQWFGWKLKSTQFVYDTKLVFERDKNMPHYAELVDLELEFFELVCKCSQDPPHIPSHIHTMEDWARYFQPDLRTYEDKKKIHIGYGITLGILLMGGVVAINSFTDLLDYSTEQSLIWTFLGSLALIGFLWYHAPERKRRGVLKKALKSEQSEYRKRLELQYNATMEEIQNYEKCKKRIDEIRDLACSLLND